MSAPANEAPAVPESWGPLVRASTALVSLVVTFCLYVGRDGPVDEGVVVGFLTAAHSAVWTVVAEAWKLRKRGLGRGVNALLILSTLGGLGGAVSSCGSVELRDDGVPCLVESARVAAELAAAVVNEVDPIAIATLAAANLVRLHQVCLEYVPPDVAPIVVVPVGVPP